MRTKIVTALLVGVTLLGGCSKKSTTPTTGGLTGGVAGQGAATGAKMPKPGLWAMTISGDTLPKPMKSQICVGAPAPGTNPFAPPPQVGQHCAKSAFTPTASGYSIDLECAMNGVTMVSKGEVSGDFSSHYTTAMTVKMTGAQIPPSMQVDHHSTVDSTYVGACPTGMAPNTARPAA